MRTRNQIRTSKYAHTKNKRRNQFQTVSQSRDSDPTQKQIKNGRTAKHGETSAARPIAERIPTSPRANKEPKHIKHKQKKNKKQQNKEPLT